MIILVLVLLGLCLGSFVNALVWRLHEQDKLTGKKAKRAAKELSISQGRSMCPDCRHQLGFWDLLPVASWLGLRGKCRYCHHSISWQYPLVEVLTAAMFVFSYAFWPHSWTTLGVFQFAVWLVIVVGFMALTVYDARWQILPDRIVYPLMVVAAINALVVSVLSEDPMHLVYALVGVACLAGLFYAIFQVSGGKWIGGGDVKLGVVIGLLVTGPVNAILVLFVASVLGLLVALPDVFRKKSGLSKRIAFGPFLMVATVFVVLFGADLADWYTRQFLLL
ncbi:MAG: leader peptidase (prepilin peptidase) / N-methyltransferase [Patescibacteria group bacterium]|nr:leader peptidase (prepilin peptidase) / N-methyltransferase [Patescibacteria group bacterium]